MTDYTVDQLKEAARRAYEAGDTARAKRFIDEARRLDGRDNPAGARREAMLANIARAKAGQTVVPQETLARLAEADQIASDQMTLAGVPAPLLALDKFNQGVPFIGQWTDELTGAIDPKAAEMQRAARGAMDRQHPAISTGLQAAGGVVGGAAMLGPLAAVAAPAAPATVGGQVLAGGVGGAVMGGAEGAISGAGRGEPGNRASTAWNDATLGAAFGGGMGMIAPVAAKGFSWGWEKLRGKDVSAIADALGIDKKAATVVRDALLYEDPAMAQAALQRAGKGAMLADAGPAMAQTLDTAMATSPQALSTARRAIGARLEAVSNKLNRILDISLGAPDGAKAAARGISQRTAAARDAAFKAAYQTPIDYADNAGRAVEGVLDRIPAGILNKAVAKANEVMRFEGRKNLQIMATISPDGQTVKFTQMPNVEQLHQIKMALGDLAEAGKDALGRMTPDGRLYGNMATAVRDAIVDATGGAGGTYAKAMKLGGDKIAEQNAFDLGRRALSASVTREDMSAALVSDEARLAAARGLRGAIDETLANVKAAFTDPNVDIRSAAKLVRDMSSPAVRQKVAGILGPQKARVMFRALDEAAAAFESRAAVAANSKTAARAAGKEAMEAVTQPGLATRAMRGELVQTAKQAAQNATGTSDAALNAIKQGQWDEIARALTQIRGKDAQNALALVQQAMAGQPLKSGEAQFIGNVLSGSGALLGYQSGTQRLRSQQTVQ